MAQEVAENLPELRMDWENLDLLNFTTDSPENKNRIKKIAYSIEMKGNKRLLLQSSFYDKKGNLIIRKNYDRFYENKGEVISINQKGSVYMVSRVANKQDIINVGTGKWSIFETYMPFMNFIRSAPGDIITILKTYALTKDSSLNYTTMINKKLIDSGTFSSLFSNAYKGLITNVTETIDTSANRDTVIIRKIRKFRESQTEDIEFSYFINNKLIKRTYPSIYKDVKETTFTVVYKYDKSWNVTNEEYWSSVFHYPTKRKSFGYDSVLKKRIFVEEIFDSNGKQKECNIFDIDNNLLEQNSSFLVDKVIQEKKLYFYLESGLTTHTSNN